MKKLYLTSWIPAGPNGPRMLRVSLYKSEIGFKASTKWFTKEMVNMRVAEAAITSDAPKEIDVEPGEYWVVSEMMGEDLKPARHKVIIRRNGPGTCTGVFSLNSQNDSIRAVYG